MAHELNTGKTTGEKIIKTIWDKTTEGVREAHKDIVIRFRLDGFYTWANIRYFLFEYDLSLQEASKTERAKIFWPEFIEKKVDFVSVEHIYPQQARAEYWTQRFGQLNAKQKNLVRNSLGNLLPLSRPKNASLSNKAFPDKVNGIEDTVIGYRFGCYSEIEVAGYSEWNPEAILKSGLKMLVFLEQRWQITLGDEEIKTDMLGLSFMLPNRSRHLVAE